ncbi:MAG: response regulator transcription factor, partial [Gemmatimonadetes bacterium]|nr:response regulator transcription factor [Gemmatimonadota bacterium]
MLALIARGRMNKEIAGDLKLSVRTVETYRERLMRKLDLHSVAELTRYAIAEGVVSLD